VRGVAQHRAADDGEHGRPWLSHNPCSVTATTTRATSIRRADLPTLAGDATAAVRLYSLDDLEPAPA
jgi:hypothetical protein